MSNATAAVDENAQLEARRRRLLLTVGTIWKHTKRGTTYEIMGVAASQIDENETDMVVYRGLDDGGMMWVRPVNRFLERTNATTYRFEKIQPVPKKQGLFCFRRGRRQQQPDKTANNNRQPAVVTTEQATPKRAPDPDELEVSYRC